VIRGEQTSEATVQTAVQWVRGLGKTPVVVKDAPGFVVNRVLSAFLDAALQLAVEGHAITEIDAAVRAFGFQAGPFEMMDLIGLDTTTLAGQSLIAAGVTQVSRLPALVKLIRQGRLGRKNGLGFYRYFTPDGPAEFDPAGEAVMAAYRTPGSSPGPTESIAPRIMAAALLAAVEVWQNETVRDPRDLDLCVIQGLSFPVHEGGLLFWASRQGPEALAYAINWAAALHPEAGPPPLLVAWQSSGQPFYSSV
jgi:3-hydroxyacyl-CoA dehydrogenase